MKFKASTLHKIGRPLVNYVYKNPKKNIPKILKVGKAVTGNLFPESTWTMPLDVITNPNNIWNEFVYRTIEHTDRELLTNMLLTFGIDAGYIGTSTLRENRDKLKCNIPWIILMDPTSACNLKCKGCWAAEYGQDRKSTRLTPVT